ncbi:hypothetical protein GDO81_018139 [Engystomops pustulosus]|uniref:Uncharacterized protein n=1 Tax=Engystomops pustulosus TaxID=76066 RepID=A0AAV7A5B0_ENGPU|nr:hypothetical protein GDO81_018139 [Engystomops pustulosus]
MEKTFMGCIKCLFDLFDMHAPNGTASREETDKFIKEQFQNILKNPKDEKTAKELLEKVNALKEKGITKEDYANLICACVNKYAKDLIGSAPEKNAN